MIVFGELRGIVFGGCAGSVGRAVRGGTYHSVHRFVLYQGAFKDLGQVCVLGSRDLREVVHKRHIEKRELVPHALEISRHIVKRMLPELRWWSDTLHDVLGPN